MRQLALTGLLILLAGCAAQTASPPDSDYRTMKYQEGQRPPILFVGAPPAGVLPQQIIGDEHHPAPGDGLS